MVLESLSKIFYPAIEAELKNVIHLIDKRRYQNLNRMMAYHMGWEGEKAGSSTRGKRIRPLLVLLTCTAAGGEWELALPAAASVELIHNFSLLHDDIEDNSPLRRGRPTIWVKWGVPQAINTGDAMFSLAHLALLNLEKTKSKIIAFQANKIMQSTCLALTQGQFLDISYESLDNIKIDDYLPMVTGKTAALLGACSQLGALIAEANEQTQANYRTFGINLGLAFQALDDLLGIWGEASKIGKSNASDIAAGKKTLPILYGLQVNGKFAARWKDGSITPDEVSALADQLESDGARSYTKEAADYYTQNALQALDKADPQGEAGVALRELANRLLLREQ
jgi:geranylgeranyl diphosphate synthase type I